MLKADNKTDDHAQRYWRTPTSVPASLAQIYLSSLDAEFTRFSEYLPTLCWLAQGDGYIVWYNRRWHEYCGTAPEQMKGWGWQSVHDPEQLPVVMARWSHCIEEGEPFEMVFPLRGADGQFRPFLTRATPLRDGSGAVKRWFGVNTEIGAQVSAEHALRASEAKFETLTDAMPQMVWSTRADGFHDYYNAQWYAFTGVPVGSTDGEAWSGLFHPDDQDRAWAKWRRSLDTGEPYEVEYRLRHHSGEYRWTLGRALPVRTAEGQITRWIGTCTDIHEAKQAAEQNELLSRELSHRIKNIFAVISGLISLTGRKAVALRPVMSELMERIGALARAHEFARPHSPESKPEFGEGSLHGLIAEVLRPYQMASRERIIITGDDVPIDDRGATPMALVIHEFATNAAKYGALSSEQGQVTIRTSRKGEQLSVEWVEQGGPAVAGQPDRHGFGTELAELSIERQLGGTIHKEWKRTGLWIRLELQVDRLSR